MTVTIKKKQLFLAVVFSVCFLCWGCGVSKSDYAELESRVKKLEKEVYGEAEPQNQEDQTNKTTPTTKIETNSVYNLSNLSVDEIVNDFTHFLTPDMTGKKPEQFLAELNLRYYPKNQTDISACFQDNSRQDFVYYSDEGDYLESLNYTYQKKMDGTLEKAKWVNMRFAIVDYQRAEEIFDRLAGHFFSDGIVQKEGTAWNARNDKSYSSMMMEKGGKSYIFTIQIDLSR